MFGIGIPNILWAVRPPFSNVAAIPDDAAEMQLFPCPLAYANIAFIRRVFPQPTGAL